MEGVIRNAGTHAAGVVITDRPIVDYAPLHRPTSGSEDSPIKSVVQFEMSIVENQGLLKVDFLGLVTPHHHAARLPLNSRTPSGRSHPEQHPNRRSGLL